ncbi:MAG: SPOR domain-containing protein [Alphaproteobacteria bacterium]
MEDFGYKKNEQIQTGTNLYKKIFLISAILLSLSIFIYISLSAYKLIYQNKREIETIKSPTQAIKTYEDSDYNEKDETRVVNRSIYEDIFGNKNNNIIQEEIKINQNIEPALPPKNFRENKKTLNVKTDDEDSDDQSLKDQEQMIEDEDEKAETNKNEKQKNELQKIQQISKNKIAEAPKPNPVKTIRKRSSIRVQISAMSSPENCKDYYRKLNQKYPTIFNKTKYYIEEADLGKRGIFYRLQIGDFFNQVDAEEFCENFIAQSQKSRSECIIVE